MTKKARPSAEDRTSVLTRTGAEEDAVRALRESEERFRRMVEGSDQLVFYIHDLSDRIEYVSPSVHVVLGYEPDELIGQNYQILFTGDPVDDRVRSLKEIAIARGEGFTTFTGFARHRNGRAVPMEVVECPIVRDGAVVGIQGFARDITDRKRAEEAIQASEASYRSLFNSLSELVYIQDRDGRFLSVNDAVVRTYGYAREELLGQGPALLAAPGLNDTAAIREALRRAFEGEPQRFEFWGRRKDGSCFPKDVVLTKGTYFGKDVAIAVGRDVTEWKRSEEENLRLAALSLENPNPVLECAADGRPLHANPAAEQVARELQLNAVTGLLPVNHAQLVQTALQQDQGFQNVEATVGGRIFSWSYRPNVVSGVVYLFAVDITGRRHMEEQLRHDALHDALTGLPNRMFFMERLAHAILRSKRRDDFQFAVLFLDLDRFKVINDSLGHHVGDELLRTVAGRLQRSLRTEDTVARFGGDEFAILLEDTGGVDDASRVAERIQAELAAPVNLSGFEVFTSGSIGIALSSSAYERPEYLLRNADMAMYRAKSSGQARFEVFDRAMHARALTRLQMETDLRRALERGEFELVYQPIITLRDGTLCGAEALIRWVHPDRGRLSPDEFISVAEETGLIVPIGSWALGEACRQLGDWQLRFGARAPDCMAVNLSPKQFSENRLVEEVQRGLEANHLDPGVLWLEITENAVMENADAAVLLLGRLKELGVRISLDDFGTGYSSLQYLHRFPLDSLKIDRSFVGQMEHEERSAHLVQTVLTLARSLGVISVAEGIEEEGQLRMLREMGCERGQGYLFARPLSAAEMEARMEASQPAAPGEMGSES
jgi:diguanylate cyclase (GGDEF)-like protein/PAS domain S-box-containing protein